MIKSAGHIISKCRWDTFFDEKEKATELQARLSYWSRLKMPAEIAGVFERICPAEQIWQIQSLQIDLGAISFNDLESELSLKLRAELDKQLSGLILYRRQNDANVEIIDEETADINLLRHFLLYGLMPWNYKDKDTGTSINDLLSIRMQNDHRAVIAMLRETGLTHENVRRRMAWQLSEANIVQIIRGLEPVYARQVVGFSNEMTAIQAKNAIVQTNLADFKKNLWFWIFNFLLAGRGSVFNKMAFIKSSISQMAGHYNVGYTDLLGMIELAINSVAKPDNLNAGIIQALAVLVQQSHSDVKALEKRDKNAMDLREVLEKYFEGHTGVFAPYTAGELNDIIIGLSAEDAAGLREVLLSFGGKENELIARIAGLPAASFEAIFSTLSTANGPAGIHYVYFMEGLCRKLNLDIEPKLLWQTAIMFLLVKKNLSFTGKEFLDYIVTELATLSHKGKTDILERMMCAEMITLDPASGAIGCYDALAAIFVSETERNNSAIGTARFTRLLDMMIRQTRGHVVDKALFSALKKTAVKYLRADPENALGVLKRYKGKTGLQKLLPYLLDDHLTALLVDNAGIEMAAVLLFVKQAAGNAGFTALIENELADTALAVMIFYPQLKKQHYPGFILRRLASVLMPAQYLHFFASVEQLMADKSAGLVPFSIDVVNQIKHQLLIAQNLPLPTQIKQLMTRPGRQEALSKLLTSYFDDRQFVQLREDDKHESGAILNYLLTGGEDLMKALMGEYMVMIKRSAGGVEADNTVPMLNDLYWRCLLDYSWHRGRAGVLQETFKTAVRLKFTIPEKHMAGHHIAGASPGASNIYFVPAGGGKITQVELFSLIGKCIKLGQDVIASNGHDFRFSELITIGLEVNGRKLRQILGESPISEKRIGILNAAMSFGEFSLLIANDAAATMHDALICVKILHDLVADLIPGGVAGKLLSAYWRASLMIVKTNSISLPALQRLVADTLHHIAREKPADSAFIISEIKNRHIRLMPALVTALAAYNPAFSVLVAAEPSRLSPQAEKIKQKGMLYKLTYHIITRGHAPLWLCPPGEQKAAGLLHEIAVNHPVNLFLVLKHEVVTARQMAWLARQIGFKTFITLIGNLNPSRRSLLSELEKLYQVFGAATITGIPVKEIQYLLFTNAISAWTTNNWDTISGTHIWRGLLWDLNGKKGWSAKQFTHDVEKIEPYLPLSMQITFGYLKQPDVKAMPAALLIPKPAQQLLQNQKIADLGKEGIPVKNAGLVLANNYIAALFERLGMVKNREFTDKAARGRAVHYLQYLVTGLSSTEEFLLPLNKIMCGLSLTQPVESGIDVAEVHHNMIEGLVKAMIVHWPAIGGSSVYGFRGNWLVRDGILTEQNDKWELVVEKRAYDILLSKSPFSFSIIRYPWMDKPLHVHWPY